MVNEKEKQIHSLQVDVDIRIKELFQKDEEIKKLREEIERMKTEKALKSNTDNLYCITNL